MVSENTLSELTEELSLGPNQDEVQAIETETNNTTDSAENEDKTSRHDFPQFVGLPLEIQSMIWAEATKEPALHYLNFYTAPDMDWEWVKKGIELLRLGQYSAFTTLAATPFHMRGRPKERVYKDPDCRVRLALPRPDTIEFKRSGYSSGPRAKLLRAVHPTVREVLDWEQSVCPTDDTEPHNVWRNVAVDDDDPGPKDDDDSRSARDIVINQERDLVILQQPLFLPQLGSNYSGAFHRAKIEFEFMHVAPRRKARLKDYETLKKFAQLSRLALSWDRHRYPLNCIGCKKLYSHYRDMKKLYYRCAKEKYDKHQAGIREKCTMCDMALETMMSKTGRDDDTGAAKPAAPLDSVWTELLQRRRRDLWDKFEKDWADFCETEECTRNEFLPLGQPRAGARFRLKEPKNSSLSLSSSTAYSGGPCEEVGIDTVPFCLEDVDHDMFKYYNHTTRVLENAMRMGAYDYTMRHVFMGEDREAMFRAQFSPTTGSFNPLNYSSADRIHSLHPEDIEIRPGFYEPGRFDEDVDETEDSDSDDEDLKGHQDHLDRWGHWPRWWKQLGNAIYRKYKDLDTSDFKYTPEWKTRLAAAAAEKGQSLVSDDNTTATTTPTTAPNLDHVPPPPADPEVIRKSLPTLRPIHGSHPECSPEANWKNEFMAEELVNSFYNFFPGLKVLYLIDYTIVLRPGQPLPIYKCKKNKPTTGVDKDEEEEEEERPASWFDNTGGILVEVADPDNTERWELNVDRNKGQGVFDFARWLSARWDYEYHNAMAEKGYYKYRPLIEPYEREGAREITWFERQAQLREAGMVQPPRVAVLAYIPPGTWDPATMNMLNN